ncbi:MAG: nuclear transport factor 2 family protein [Hyphomonadaceae bacterium]|nr:nuclear transport factor 2 family protein [Hyphomonadaceae bacterium]
MLNNRSWTMLVLACAALLLPLSAPAYARSAPVTREQLLDRIQIEDMMTEYYSLLNGYSVHDVAEYFTENAVFIANGARIEGRAAIQNLYSSGGDPRVVEGNKYTMILSNPRISVRGATATMDCIWTGYLLENVYTAPRLVEQGTEHTEFTKRNGVWMITSRTITHLGGNPDVPARRD